MHIVADHTWLVSGTPVNTSFNDIRNQLSFLGIENVEGMLDIFRQTAFVHSKDQGKDTRSWYSGTTEPIFGNLLFFLRSINDPSYTEATVSWNISQPYVASAQGK